LADLVPAAVSTGSDEKRGEHMTDLVKMRLNRELTAISDRPVRASDKLRKLPFYLVCDVSLSMADEGRIQAVNDAILEISETLADEPLLADLAYFSVIDFSDDSTVVIPLGDMSEREFGDTILRVRGGTSYSSAFTTLRSTIESDVTALRQVFDVFRPTVFFLSDGAPTDGGQWQAAFDRLVRYDRETKTGFEFYPMVVPFGIGEADKRVLAKLVHPAGRSKLYLTKEGAKTGEAIKQMATAMLRSIVASAQSATGGAHPQITLPSKRDLGDDVEVYSADADLLG
jgi:uncharacterized protein YegL